MDRCWASFLGGHLVSWNHSYRASKRGAPKFRLTPHEGPLPYPQKQPPYPGRVVQQALQGLCRGMSKQGPQICKFPADTFSTQLSVTDIQMACFLPAFLHHVRDSPVTHWFPVLQRPTAKELLKHKFITRYTKKTSFLAELIDRYRRWKSEGHGDESSSDDSDMYVTALLISVTF